MCTFGIKKNKKFINARTSKWAAFTEKCFCQSSLVYLWPVNNVYCVVISTMYTVGYTQKLWHWRTTVSLSMSALNDHALGVAMHIHKRPKSASKQIDLVVMRIMLTFTWDVFGVKDTTKAAADENSLQANKKCPQRWCAADNPYRWSWLCENTVRIITPVSDDSFFCS